MASRRNLLAGLIFIFVCFTANSCFSAALKIGIMNVQQIIVECDAGKAAKGRLDAKTKELEPSLKAEGEALNALQDEIKKKSSAWSEEKKAEKFREYQKNGRELQVKTEKARFEMKKLEEKEFGPILKALEEIVKTYGKENGYTAIMDERNGVVYFDPAVDISDIMVKKLNGALAKK